MMRARASTDAGRTVIVLGLTEANVEQMRAGHPMHLHADELGFVGEIMLFLGKDEATLAKEFAPAIGPDTIVHDESRKARQ